MELSYFSKLASTLKLATKSWVKNHVSLRLAGTPGIAQVGSLMRLVDGLTPPAVSGMVGPADFPVRYADFPGTLDYTVAGLSTGKVTQLPVPSNGLPYKAVCVASNSPMSMVMGSAETFSAFAVQGSNFNYTANTEGGWSAGPGLTGSLIQDYRRLGVDLAGNLLAIPESGAYAAFSAAAAGSARTWISTTLDAGNIQQLVDLVFVNDGSNPYFLASTNGVNGAGSDYLLKFNIASRTWSRVALPVSAGKTYKWGQFGKNTYAQDSGQTLILGCVSEAGGASVNFVMISYDAGVTWTKSVLPVSSKWDMAAVVWKSALLGGSEYFVVSSSQDQTPYFSEDGTNWRPGTNSGAPKRFLGASPYLVTLSSFAGARPAISVGFQPGNLIKQGAEPAAQAAGCIGAGHATASMNVSAQDATLAVIYPTDSAGRVYTAVSDFHGARTIPFPDPNFDAGNYRVRLF